MIDTADTTVFKSNRTQAVRLSKDVAFPESVTKVRVIKQGRARLIVPLDALWEDFFDSEPYADFPDRPPQGDWPQREPL